MRDGKPVKRLAKSTESKSPSVYQTVSRCVCIDSFLLSCRFLLNLIERKDRLNQKELTKRQNISRRPVFACQFDWAAQCSPINDINQFKSIHANFRYFIRSSESAADEWHLFNAAISFCAQIKRNERRFTRFISYAATFNRTR